MTLLSKHFSLEEFTTTQIRGLDNTPNDIVLAHLRVTATRMENIRDLLNHPVIILSGYRSPKVNQRVGGAKNSAHLEGYAADFICPRFGSPLEVCREIMRHERKFDQLIYEGTWTHISFSPLQRGNLLTAHFTDAGTTYSTGIA